MIYWLIPLIIGAVFLTIFLVERVKEKRVTAVIFKGLTSLMFILTALLAWMFSNRPTCSFGIFILIALFFGLLGDVFLDIKFITKKYEDLFTRLGFISFGIGHIFFISGLFQYYFYGGIHVLFIIIPAIVAFALAIFSLLMEKFMPIRYGNMKPFIPTYGVLLFFVTAIYFSFAIFYKWNLVNINMMAIAFILFALSDLILNNTYFSEGFNKPIHIILNHVLYYIAQFMIAVSLFFLM